MSNVKFRIENIVVFVDFFIDFNFEKVIEICLSFKYNLEEFLGIICCFDDLKVVFLIFSLGKFVVIGVKSVDDIKRVVYKFIEMLKKIGVKFIREF